MTTVTSLNRVNDDSNEAPSGPTVRRTHLGSEELVVQKQTLTEAQRQVLLYANGKRSLDAIASMVPTVAKDRATVEELRQPGL